MPCTDWLIMHYAWGKNGGNLLLFFKIYVLSISGQYHRENDNMDYFYQLEIWKGNISGALRIAREREELSDWLVAMAPMGMQQIDYLYCRYLYRYNVNQEIIHSRHYLYCLNNWFHCFSEILENYIQNLGKTKANHG